MILSSVPTAIDSKAAPHAAPASSASDILLRDEKLGDDAPVPTFTCIYYNSPTSSPLKHAEDEAKEIGKRHFVCTNADVSPEMFIETNSGMKPHGIHMIGHHNLPCEDGKTTFAFAVPGQLDAIASIEQDDLADFIGNPHLNGGRVSVVFLSGCCSTSLARAVRKTANSHGHKLAIFCFDTLVLDDFARDFAKHVWDHLSKEPHSYETAFHLSLAQVRGMLRTHTSAAGQIRRQKYKLIDPMQGYQPASGPSAQCPEGMEYREEPIAGFYPRRPSWPRWAGVPRLLLPDGKEVGI